MFYNALTNHIYSETNQKLLVGAADENACSFEIAGYNQWQELGYQVMKGQKATKVLIVVEKKDKEGKKKKVCKNLAVFFKHQVEEMAAKAA